MSTVTRRLHPTAGLFGKGESVGTQAQLTLPVGASWKTQLIQSPGLFLPWLFSFLFDFTRECSCLSRP